MLMRILGILAMAASVVGAVYTVASFYSSPQQVPPSMHLTNGMTPSSQPSTGSYSRIEQRSTGNNSPNIIGDGNVSVLNK